jgi:MFS family permease
LLIIDSTAAPATNAAATVGPGEETGPAPYPAGEPTSGPRDVQATLVRSFGLGVAHLITLVSDRLGFFGVSGRKESSWQVLGHRQFRRFFVGSLVSNAGTWLQNTAQMLLAYQIRHSVLTVGLVTCAQFSSPLLLGPWAGWFADRFGSRRTLLATQAVSMLITAALAGLQFSQVLGERSLLVGAFLTGLMFTFALPAQSVIISSLVPSEGETKAAMAMNSVSYNAGRALAPAFGVLIVVTVGFGWAFVINAVSFGVFAVVLLTVRPCCPLPATGRSRIRDGFGVLRDERKIVLLLIMVAMVTFADDPVLVLGPALARHVSTSGDISGCFLSALGAGSVLGSLLPRRKSQSARRVATALALLGVSMIVFAVVPDIVVSTIAALAAGIAGLVAGSAAQAMLVGLAGRERALRVMGLWTVAWAGSKPIASLIDGTLPGLIGIRMTGVILACPTLLPIIVLIFCPSIVHRVIKPHTAAGAVPAERMQPFEIDAPAAA